jgi:hypothetical protein
MPGEDSRDILPLSCLYPTTPAHLFWASPTFSSMAYLGPTRLCQRKVCGRKTCEVQLRQSTKTSILWQFHATAHWREFSFNDVVDEPTRLYNEPTILRGLFLLSTHEHALQFAGIRSPSLRTTLYENRQQVGFSSDQKYPDPWELGYPDPWELGYQAPAIILPLPSLT